MKTHFTVHATYLCGVLNGPSFCGAVSKSGTHTLIVAIDLERVTCLKCLSRVIIPLCARCGGTVEMEVSRDVTPSEDTGGMSEATGYLPCGHCQGTGVNPYGA